MERIYFDNAATTPLSPEVLEAMMPYLKDHFGNPSSIHGHGRQVRSAVEKARKTVAELLNTSPSEIFFTSGGTEADNTAIRNTIEAYQIKHAISSPIEHHAVLHTLEHLQRTGLVELHLVKLDESGHVDYTHLEELMKAFPGALVSLMHANNEVGNLTNIHKVADMAMEYGCICHTDTVQTMGHYVHDLQKLKAKCIVGAAHKFHGPKGVGFLYVNNEHKIHPFIHGGAQERNMRGGTENIYGIIGLAKALEICYAEMQEHQSHIQLLKNYMIEKLKGNIMGVEFNGASAVANESLYTVLNVSLPETFDAEMMLFNLDINGISASGGSACSSGSNIGSHVLTAIGVSPNRPSVRFSFSKYNTTEEVDFVVSKLKAMQEDMV